MKLKVLSCEEFESNYKIKIEYLDDEHFYPDGKGGQIGDLGKIGVANIIRVAEDYILIDTTLDVGVYEYSFDKDRRDDASQNHSGEHIFSAIAFLNYGWRTHGFKMSEKYCTLDFDVTNVSDDIVADIEKLVNDKIKEGHKISERVCNVEEAIEVLGERKGIPEKVKGDVKIISTFPEDYNPCGGLHVTNTKDIRAFKILSYEKVKSTYTRFYFISGDRVMKDYSLKHNICTKLGTIFSSQPDGIIPMIEKYMSDKKETEKSLKNLSDKYAQLLVDNSLSACIKINTTTEKNISLIIFDEESHIINSIKNVVQNSNINNYLVVTHTNDTNSFSIISDKINCSEILNMLKVDFTLKGGGNNKAVTFMGDITLDIIKDKILNYNL